jgi:hypothetical protein
MVHDVPNASKRTSRTGERDDRLVTSFLVDDMVLVASEQILDVESSGIVSVVLLCM